MLALLGESLPAFDVRRRDLNTTTVNIPILVPIPVLVLEYTLYLLLIPTKYILLTAREIRVDLTGQERVFRNVRLPRILVQRKEKKPDHADEDAEQ